MLAVLTTIGKEGLGAHYCRVSVGGGESFAVQRRIQDHAKSRRGYFLMGPEVRFYWSRVLDLWGFKTLGEGDRMKALSILSHLFTTVDIAED